MTDIKHTYMTLPFYIYINCIYSGTWYQLVATRRVRVDCGETQFCTYLKSVYYLSVQIIIIYQIMICLFNLSFFQQATY